MEELRRVNFPKRTAVMLFSRRKVLGCQEHLNMKRGEKGGSVEVREEEGERA